MLPRSRYQELEADQLGVDMLAMACYRPDSALKMQELLGQIDGQSSSNNAGFFTYLSTHPATSERVAAIRQKLPSAELYYQQNCRSRIAVLLDFIRNSS